ncbi:MAG: hypothetical protein OXD48_07430, partial [Litoreibacter sp.]|nr:hypothetical protein [Litoreibacter sp.]
LDTCFLIGHLDEVQWRTLDELYIRSALPKDLALTHNAVMICKAGDTSTDRTSEMWFEMFHRYCKRDQLTMQLAEHLSGAKANRMHGKLTDIAKWPVFMPQDRDKSVIPPDLFKPKAKLSLARQKFKRLQKQKMTLIEKRQSMR